MNNILINYLKLRKFRKWKCIKLNIGCGEKKFKGWINVDLGLNSDLNIDVRDGLPFKDNSVDFIYNEHFLEHLSFNECYKVLLEFYRCLKKDGVVRMALPDLDYIIKKYNQDWKNQDWLSWSRYKFIKTRGQMINFSIRGSNHKYLYNQEDLRNQLIKVNFKEIICCDFNKSHYKELCNLETRKDSKLIIESKK